MNKKVMLLSLLVLGGAGFSLYSKVYSSTPESSRGWQLIRNSLPAIVQISLRQGEFFAEYQGNRQPRIRQRRDAVVLREAPAFAVPDIEDQEGVQHRRRQRRGAVLFREAPALAVVQNVEDQEGVQHRRNAILLHEAPSLAVPDTEDSELDGNVDTLGR